VRDRRPPEANSVPSINRLMCMLPSPILAQVSVLVHRFSFRTPLASPISPFKRLPLLLPALPNLSQCLTWHPHQQLSLSSRLASLPHHRAHRVLSGPSLPERNNLGESPRIIDDHRPSIFSTFYSYCQPNLHTAKKKNRDVFLTMR
jgi:hypothetical protein